MKRIIAILCMLAISMTSYVIQKPEIALTASAEDYTDVVEGGLKFRIYDTYAECIYCKSEEAKIEIPAEIDGLPVTAIDKSAFAQCRTLTEVQIPDSVKEIRDTAFYGCPKLRTVVIPESVTELGNGVFAYCSALKSIHIPSSITSWDSTLFAHCFSLSEITVAESNPNYCSDNGILFDKTKETLVCFPSNHTLTEYSIPDTVKRVENYAFMECTELTSVTIPNNVKEIGKGAFEICVSLTELELPDSIISIGAIAFQECTGLKTMRIPETVTELSDGLFQNCTGLESITLPDTLTAIGKQTFSKCYSLCTIEIPDAVTRIGRAAFGQCTSLVSVTIPEGVTVIEDSMFFGCEALETIGIPNTVNNIEQMAFYKCNSLQSIEIPEGVKEIDSHAFSYCDELESVTLPKSLDKLGYSVFRQCPALTTLVIKNAECEIGNLDGISAKCTVYTVLDSTVANLAESCGYDVKPLAIISGDVNADGVFSVADVELLQKWLLAVPDTHLADWKAADFYEDGKLDVFDLCLSKRKLINTKEETIVTPSDMPEIIDETETITDEMKKMIWDKFETTIPNTDLSCFKLVYNPQKYSSETPGFDVYYNDVYVFDRYTIDDSSVWFTKSGDIKIFTSDFVKACENLDLHNYLPEEQARKNCMYQDIEGQLCIFNYSVSSEEDRNMKLVYYYKFSEHYTTDGQLIDALSGEVYLNLYKVQFSDNNSSSNPYTYSKT